MKRGDDEDARHTRRQSSDVPPLEADAPKQQRAKRVSFALTDDSSQDEKKTLSTKRHRRTMPKSWDQRMQRDRAVQAVGVEW